MRNEEPQEEMLMQDDYDNTDCDSEDLSLEDFVSAYKVCDVFVVIKYRTNVWFCQIYCFLFTTLPCGLLGYPQNQSYPFTLQTYLKLLKIPFYTIWVALEHTSNLKYLLYL